MGVSHLFFGPGSLPPVICCLVSPVSVSDDDDTSVAQMTGA